MIAFLILTCALSLLLSFLCSIMEAVLLSLNPMRLKAEQQRGAEQATRWLHLKENIERPIAAILIINTAANVGLGTVAGGLFLKIFGAQWIWLFSLCFTLAVLIGTELVPKVLGINHNRRLAPLVLPVLNLLLIVLRPAVSLMEKVCSLMRPPAVNGNPRDEHIMDIIALTQVAKAENIIHSYEEIIIIHAATLSARRVRSVMKPADAIAVFRLDRTTRENLKSLPSPRYSRYPVVRSGEGGDTFAGKVDLRQLLHSERFPESLDGLLTPLLTVAPETTLTQLLAKFCESNEKIALVTNETGAVLGLVTLDDVFQLVIGKQL